ncbi:MAG: universal stress protein [Parafilimonas sp.]
MKRILVPTDFSPNALSALRIAADIALRNKGTIILYHVYTPAKRTVIADKIEREQYNIQAETIILKRLQRVKKTVLKDFSGITISTIIGRSPLLNNILGFAEHNYIDMIVMGTKGASGIKKVFIGSVAAKIAQSADVPVLLIPEKFRRAELDSIVFASDFHVSDENALSFSLAFSRLYNSTLTIVHVLSGDTSEKKRQKDKNDFETYAYYLQRKLNKNNLKFQLLTTAPGSDKIKTLYKEIPYNMLVMVRTRKSFFQKIFSMSFTQSMAYIANKPLLIIPAEEPGEEVN